MKRDATSKVCTKCLRALSLEDFGKHSKGALCSDGLKRRAVCRECCSAYDKGLRLANPGKHRETRRKWRLENPDYHLKRTYGMDIAGRDRLIEGQGGKCAICATDTPDGVNGTFHVDHDHDRGTVRGMLCMSCNIALGKLKDNPENIAAALVYLGAHGKALSPTDLRDFLRCYPVRPPRKPRRRLHHSP